jgi:hypothetical protein
MLIFARSTEDSLEKKTATISIRLMYEFSSIPQNDKSGNLKSIITIQQVS